MVFNLKPKTQNIKSNQEGVAVILVVLLMSIFLSMTLTLSAIFIPKIRTASDIKRSSGALYAAESGVEWCLYVNRIGSAEMPVLSNGATFINGNTNALFIPADCSTLPIKSIGTYEGVTRSLEVNI
ncbi:MAG: hypothetical protein HYT61_03880 [Candidatus Yanofskybacteria bacterium]|nr:hypothetical protein [Candidatus Yanofskybacteria bacterium]